MGRGYLCYMSITRDSAVIFYSLRWINLHITTEASVMCYDKLAPIGYVGLTFDAEFYIYFQGEELIPKTFITFYCCISSLYTKVNIVIHSHIHIQLLIEIRISSNHFCFVFILNWIRISWKLYLQEKFKGYVFIST